MNKTNNNDPKNIAEFNNTGAAFPAEKTIHELFEEQVDRAPGQTAAIFGNRKLTYRELNEKANQLARVLRSKGIGRDSLIGIMAERSLEMIIGIYAILKAGGAYLPISTSNPVMRIVHLLKESGTKIVLTQGKFRKLLAPAEEAAFIINLEDESLYQGLADNLTTINTSQDLIYIIYTSGSTGKPKGVAIEHRSVVNRLHWMQRKYPLTSADLILQKTPFFFDVSVWEMFWWSLVGAGVCFLPPGGEKFPQFIVEAVEKNKITVMHFVPSMMSVFLEYLRHSEQGEEIKRLSSLRQVFASGEKLTSSHVQAFNDILHQKNGTRLANLYGPTEATVDVTYFDCPVGDEPIDKIPIGKPIDNTELYILGEDGRPLAIGETGELYIGGVGVARGYLNNPEMTAAKFILPSATKNPFEKGFLDFPKLLFNYNSPLTIHPSPIYKTGDLSRWMSDGNVDFLGRGDHQVKIHGLRIELEEIESVLSGHPSVRDCVIAVKKYSENITMIVGYIITKQDITVKELKDYLKGILPDYMVPNIFVYMQEFQLTPTGKVDRSALPEPQLSAK